MREPPPNPPDADLDQRGQASGRIPQAPSGEMSGSRTPSDTISDRSGLLNEGVGIRPCVNDDPLAVCRGRETVDSGRQLHLYLGVNACVAQTYLFAAHHVIKNFWRAGTPDLTLSSGRGDGPDEPFLAGLVLV